MARFRNCTLCTAGALLLVGCASGTPFDQQGVAMSGGRMQTNTAGTMAEGAAIVGLLGAFGGCLIAEATGGSCGDGALIGGGAGAATGALVGYGVASANQGYAAQEADLSASITQAQRKVTQNQQAIYAAQQLAAQHRAALAQIRQQISWGGGNQVLLQDRLNRIRNDQRSLDTLINQTTAEINRIDAELGRGGSSAQIVQLRQQRDTLSAQRNELARVRQELTGILAATQSAG